MHFICDFCNTVVDKGTTSCPKCGLAFSNTRCPACGFIGAIKSFENGCPKCSRPIKKHIRYSEQKPKQKEASGIFGKIKTLSPLSKFIILIVGINIALVWYITYVQLFK